MPRASLPRAGRHFPNDGQCLVDCESLERFRSSGRAEKRGSYIQCHKEDTEYRRGRGMDKTRLPSHSAVDPEGGDQGVKTRWKQDKRAHEKKKGLFPPPQESRGAAFVDHVHLTHPNSHMAEGNHGTRTVDSLRPSGSLGSPNGNAENKTKEFAPRGDRRWHERVEVSQSRRLSQRIFRRVETIAKVNNTVTKQTEVPEASVETARVVITAQHSGRRLNLAVR